MLIILECFFNIYLSIDVERFFVLKMFVYVLVGGRRKKMMVLVKTTTTFQVEVATISVTSSKYRYDDELMKYFDYVCNNKICFKTPLK